MVAGATAAVLSVAGYGLAQNSEPKAGGDGPAPEAAAALDTVAATVNGSEITLSDLEIELASLPEQVRSAPLQAIYPVLLERMVERRLAAQAAREEGLLDDPEVKRHLAHAEERILHEAYLRKQISPQLSDEKLRARYEGEIAGQPGPVEVHARHILLPTEAEAVDVAEKARGGAEFAALAAEHSTGPSAQKGGDLGYFQEGQMVAPFWEAASALQPGDISDPVQTQFGWHVIKVEDKRTTEPSFQETAPELRQELAREVVSDLVTSLREDAEIERFAMDGSPLPEGEEPASGAE